MWEEFKGNNSDVEYGVGRQPDWYCGEEEIKSMHNKDDSK
jgi:hypothetical protein